MRERWILAAALVAAAALRLWSIDFGFPGRYRPDEGYIVLKAFRVLQGQLDPGFYVYPSLYIYATALVLGAVQTLGELFGLFGGMTFAAFAAAREAVPVYLTGRLTTAALGVAGVFAAYLLGRDAFGRGAGLLGAMLLALNFSHARESHFATTDVPAALLATLVLWRLLPLARRARLRDYLLAGGLAGLAVSTKYTAAVLAVPCLAAHLLALRERRREWSRSMLLDRPLAALAAAFAAFACTSPYVLLNSGRFREDVSTFITGELLRGEGLPVGELSAGLPWIFGFGLRYGAGYFLTALAVAGAGYALYLAVCRRPGGDASLLLLAFAGGVLAAYCLTVVLFFRYMALPMPVLCLLAANAALAACRWVFGIRWSLSAAAAVVLLAAAEPAWRTVCFNRIAGRVDTRQLARQWIEANVPEGDVLVARGRLKYARPQLPGPEAYVSFTRYRDARARNPRRFPPAWFVVDSHPISAYSPQPPPAVGDLLEREGTVVRRFSPFVEGRSKEAVFDAADAFYIPVAGFGAVVRPGPGLTIYRVPGG